MDFQNTKIGFEKSKAKYIESIQLKYAAPRQ